MRSLSLPAAESARGSKSDAASQARLDAVIFEFDLETINGLMLGRFAPGRPACPELTAFGLMAVVVAVGFGANGAPLRVVAARAGDGDRGPGARAR